MKSCMKKVPLYIQAKENKLGSLELMDIETLEWIESTSDALDLDMSGFAEVQFEPIDFELLRINATKLDWFFSREHINSIHGIGHSLRVMVNTLLLCKYLHIIDPLPHVVAASIHDIQRKNDNADPEHGNRAASWFQINQKSLSSNEKLSSDDRLMIIASVKNHSLDYADMPSSDLNVYKDAIDILKAADALDRFRMPKEKWWPRVEFINLEVAHKLIPYSRKLTIESERMILSDIDQYEAVLDTADKIFGSSISNDTN